MGEGGSSDQAQAFSTIFNFRSSRTDHFASRLAARRLVSRNYTQRPQRGAVSAARRKAAYSRGSGTGRLEKREERRRRTRRVLLVCTFIRHNARAAVGIIGTPGAIAMLRGIANYRCASSPDREPCTKARIRSVCPSLSPFSLFLSFTFSFLFFLGRGYSRPPRHDDDRAYPLIRPGGRASRAPEKVG